MLNVQTGIQVSTEIKLAATTCVQLHQLYLYSTFPKQVSQSAL